MQHELKTTPKQHYMYTNAGWLNAVISDDLVNHKTTTPSVWSKKRPK